MAAKKTEAKDHSVDKDDDDDDDDDDDEDMVVRPNMHLIFQSILYMYFSQMSFYRFISFLTDIIHHGCCA